MIRAATIILPFGDGDICINAKTHRECFEMVKNRPVFRNALKSYISRGFTTEDYQFLNREAALIEAKNFGQVVINTKRKKRNLSDKDLVYPLPEFAVNDSVRFNDGEREYFGKVTQITEHTDLWSRHYCYTVRVEDGFAGDWWIMDEIAKDFGMKKEVAI